MTELKCPDQAVGAGQGSPAPAAIKMVRPVLFWSTAGAVFIAFATYVYLSWILSGNATPVDPGPDPIPGGTRLAIIAFQIACPIMALGAIVYVVRKSLRERQLCVEAAIVIGSTIAWWHDPLINWFQPVLFYNAGLVNFGNWMENVPGSLSPGSRFMVEPVLMIGMIYIWMPLTMGSIARWAMGRARRRWPMLGPVRTFCCGWLAVHLVEFQLEIFASTLGRPTPIRLICARSIAVRTPRGPAPMERCSTIASTALIDYFNTDGSAENSCRIRSSSPRLGVDNH
jgi:hypothetical protein